MEYTAPDDIPYYNECEPLVRGLGYTLVECTIFKRQGNWQVRVVIASPSGVGIADCSKVHRALLTRLEALLDSRDVFIEVTSPGLDRLIKNAAEFAAFTGTGVRIWDTDCSDWVSGIIAGSDNMALRLKTPDGEQLVPYTRIAKAKLNNS